MSNLKRLFLFALIIGCKALPTPQNYIRNFFDDFNPVMQGGATAVERSHPHMVALTKGLTVRTYICGGSFIGVRTVLTAAHCVAAAYAYGSLISSLRGIVGTNHWKSSGTAYSFSGNATHEHYVSSLRKNDIGLLFTTTDILYNNIEVSPISLSYEFVPADVEVKAAGWGRTWVFGDISENLLEIRATVIDGQRCVKEVERIKLNEQFQNSSSVEPHIEICTFRAAGVGTCIGDSGSALVRVDNKKQVGIVSWGFPCAKGVPDVYVRISAYEDWISSRIQ